MYVDQRCKMFLYMHPIKSLHGAFGMIWLDARVKKLHRRCIKIKL